MKNFFYAILVLALVGAGAYWFFSSVPEEVLVAEPEEELIEQEEEIDVPEGPIVMMYSDSDLGLEFEYGEGYVVSEMLPGETDADLLRTLVIARAEDLENVPEGGEGLPTITIHILRNPESRQSEAWAEANQIFSNINLKTGEVEETVVGGANAIRYRADGLYASDNAVVAHGGNIYVLSGAFQDEDSEIRQAFQPLLDSVRFVPMPGQE